MNPNVTPVDWAKRPIQKYADFSGRAPRAEYWWYALALIILFVVVSVVESLLGLKGMIAGVYGPLTGVLWLATLVPGLAVGVRRLHDTNRSALWLLLIVPYAITILLAVVAVASGSIGGLASAGVLGIIGMLCAIGLLVLMVLPSTPGTNRYGPNPYGEGGDTAVPAE